MALYSKKDEQLDPPTVHRLSQQHVTPDSPSILPLFPSPRHFDSSVLSPTPSLTRLSRRMFGNASTSAHHATSRGLALSAPVVHAAPTVYNQPALALYPHGSEVGPEIVWSVEGGGGRIPEVSLFLEL